jgi:hypothetical protein
MEGLLGLVEPILAQLALTHGGNRRAPPTMVDMACVLLAALVTMAAAGCLVAALWLAVLARFGPVAAAVACAVALLLVGAILTLIEVRFRARPKTARPPMLIELLHGIDGEKLIHDHKVDLLIGALVIGLVVGSSAPKPSRPDRSR